MGLAYEPSLSGGRYQVSGTIGKSRSRISTKDLVFKKLLWEFFLLPLLLFYVTTLYGT